MDRGLDVLDVGEREVGPVETLEPRDDDVQVRVAPLDPPLTRTNEAARATSRSRRKTGGVTTG
jgi:hypothetical protein